MAHSLLQLGSSGADVVVAQTHLINRGYSVGPPGADGKFGYHTRRAVIDYQDDRSAGSFSAFNEPLVADGKVGSHTWSRLDPPLVKRNDNNDSVKLAQMILASSGYSPWDPGRTDGNFDAGTETAVKTFQGDMGLPVDGKIGVDTWTALWS